MTPRSLRVLNNPVWDTQNGPVTDDDAYRVCPRCDGDGWADEYEGEVCATCWGDGEILR